MNKSKFLKKSLAMLLAIMMVVAMIPLSAAAEDAPTDPAPTPELKHPDVTANNRTATYADGKYTVTVYDTTTVSLAWVTEPDYELTITTARNVKRKLPVNGIDLLTEATKVSDNVYTIDLEIKDTAKENAVENTTIEFTVGTTVPNDDTTLRAIRPNQSWREDTTDYTFKGIKGTVDNENAVITIVLPLGMTRENVGLGDGTAFGNASATSGDIQFRRVFVPSSAHAEISYKDGANQMESIVTVTAPDKHTKNYTVKFVHEAALSDVGVKLVAGKDHYNTVLPADEGVLDSDGKTLVYTILVPDFNITNTQAHVLFNHDENVLRVEDPNNGTDNSAVTWSNAASATNDEPIKSEQNTITFTAENGTLVAYLNVKTEANYDDGVTTDPSYFKNVKIVLRDKAATTAGTPEMITFQLNGYEAKWNFGGLPTSFDYMVDSNYIYRDGAGVHPARISLRTDSEAVISVPAQDDDGDGSYWKVVATATGADLYLNKPNLNSATYIDNLDTGDGSFTIRVANPSDAAKFTDYKITIKRAQNAGTDIQRAYLVNGKGEMVYEATKTAGTQDFVFRVPESVYAANSTIVDVPAVQKKINNAPTEILFPKTATANKFTISVNGGGDFAANLATVLADIGIDDGSDLKIVWNDTSSCMDLQAKKNGAYVVIAEGEGSAADKRVITFTGLDTDDTEICTITNTNASLGTANPSVATWLKQFVGSGYILKDSAGKTTTFTAPKDATYIQTLHSNLTGLYLILESSDGAVVTPGGLWRGTNTYTNTLGDSVWTVDPGVRYWSKFANSNYYTETENGKTTLGSLWNTNYLLNKTRNAPGTTANTDVLILSVSNNNDETHKGVWTISFEKDNGSSSNNKEAELDLIGASTALEEDLLHGGRTMTDFADLANRYATPTAAPDVNRADAPYIGTMGGHNYYAKADQKIEILPIPNGNGKEYAIKIHVPEDFGVDAATNAAVDETIYLDGLTSSANSTVYRADANTPTAYNAYTNDDDNWYVPYLVDGISLDMDDQTKAGNGILAKQFAIDCTTPNADLAAWSADGKGFTPSRVSETNKLYVVSQDDAAKWAAASVGTDPNKAAAAATRVYYVTVVKDKAKTGDSLVNVSGNDKVNATAGRYYKTINIDVPYSYNWNTYRDNDSKDFKLTWTVDDGAVLLNAADDTTRKPFNTTDAALDPYFTKMNDQNRVDNSIDSDTTFFVKDNELWIIDPLTGDETQVTGMGANTKYLYQLWGTILGKEAELHVYNENQHTMDNYRLQLTINGIDKQANILSLRVDETPAELDVDTLTAKVDLTHAEEVDITKVRLDITVSPMATIESVDGEEYDPADHLKTFNLSNPIPIVVVAEDGVTKNVWTLSANEIIEPTPSPTPSEKPTPSPTPDFDVLEKYPDLAGISAGTLEEISRAVQAGLVNGVSANEFAPKATMPRWQFAVLIARAKLLEEGVTGTTAELNAMLVERYGTDLPFSDTENLSDYRKAAIAYCLDNGYMEGIPGNKFDTYAPITRQQAAVAMARVAGLTMDNTDVSMFKDGDKIANWAKAGVRAAYDAKLINGRTDGTFDPKANLNRAEGACLMTRNFLKDDEPENPDDGDEPSNPDDGDEPSNPDDGDEPSNPDEGDEPSNPDEGSEPSNPDEGSEPSNPDEGGDTSEPSTPDEGGDTSEPTE